jgi:hypothetical protein
MIRLATCQVTRSDRPSPNSKGDSSAFMAVTIPDCT